MIVLSGFCVLASGGVLALILSNSELPEEELRVALLVFGGALVISAVSLALFTFLNRKLNSPNAVGEDSPYTRIEAERRPADQGASACPEPIALESTFGEGFATAVASVTAREDSVIPKGVGNPESTSVGDSISVRSVCAPNGRTTLIAILILTFLGIPIGVIIGGLAGFGMAAIWALLLRWVAAIPIVREIGLIVVFVVAWAFTGLVVARWLAWIGAAAGNQKLSLLCAYAISAILALSSLILFYTPAQVERLAEQSTPAFIAEHREIVLVAGAIVAAMVAFGVAAHTLEGYRFCHECKRQPLLLPQQSLSLNEAAVASLVGLSVSGRGDENRICEFAEQATSRGPYGVFEVRRCSCGSGCIEVFQFLRRDPVVPIRKLVLSHLISKKTDSIAAE